MYHGMLTVYKEKGYTSSDAVARLRGILRMRKIGHTGTLDPDAEGVLPMCLGRATRICELIADREKEYRAVMRLGVRTDTQDMSGTVLEEISDREVAERLGPPEEAAQRIREAAGRLTGQIDQIPPMYSAVKINGKRLYDMARKGITVERQPRRITVYGIEIEEIALPLVTMRVRCSKGTYIRTLCEDMGAILGTGAAMQSLLRTRVGQFALGEARTLDELERLAKTEPESLAALIRPVDSFFAGCPAAACAEAAQKLLKNGNALRPAQIRLLTGSRDPLARDMAAGSCADAGTDRPAAQGQAAGQDGAAGQTVADAADRLLPGISPGEEVVRMYDSAGRFFGLYRRPAGKSLYTSYKMFIPED